MSADNTDTEVREERAESVKKAFETPTPGRDPKPQNDAPDVDTEVESVTRRAEDVARQEHEAGRYSTGPDDSPTGWPTGKSTPRDMTSVDPDDD